MTFPSQHVDASVSFASLGLGPPRGVSSGADSIFVLTDGANGGPARLNRFAIPGLGYVNHADLPGGMLAVDGGIDGAGAAIGGAYPYVAVLVRGGSGTGGQLITYRTDDLTSPPKLNTITGEPVGVTMFVGPSDVTTWVATRNPNAILKFNTFASGPPQATLSLTGYGEPIGFVVMDASKTTYDVGLVHVLVQH